MGLFSNDNVVVTSPLADYSGIMHRIQLRVKNSQMEVKVHIQMLIVNILIKWKPEYHNQMWMMVLNQTVKNLIVTSQIILSRTVLMKLI